MSAEHDFTFCATDWSGMSKEDIPNAIAALKDLSKFPSIPDRLQQGILNTLYLGRLLIHPQGFAANPAFQGTGGQPLLDISHLYWDSNSQGAIVGGATTAVAPDWRRAVLGVATMDFATLLPRSTDFDTYNVIFAPPTPMRASGCWRYRSSRCSGTAARPTDGPAHVTTNPPRDTPSAHRAHARSGRRPPGSERDERRRGAHDRRLRLSAGSGPRSFLRRNAAIRHPNDPALTPGADRRSSTGTADRKRHRHHRSTSPTGAAQTRTTSRGAPWPRATKSRPSSHRTVPSSTCAAASPATPTTTSSAAQVATDLGHHPTSARLRPPPSAENRSRPRTREFSRPSYPAVASMEFAPSRGHLAVRHGPELTSFSGYDD